MTTDATTENAPTYTEAAKLVELLYASEVRDLLIADGNPSIYQYGRPRVIAFDIHVSAPSPRVLSNTFGVSFSYCDRKGYTRDDGHVLSHKYVVGRFTPTGYYKIGREVPTIFRLRDGRYIAANSN